MKLFITLVLIPLILADYSLYMGFDTSISTLDPSFFDCVAGRINYNRNGFAVIPYIPTSDFVGQIIQAKKAGFLEVHLMLDPSYFSLLFPDTLAATIQSALWDRGTGISGVWIVVNQYTSAWGTNKTANVETITTLLNDLSDYLRPKFGDVEIGVATTGSDWQSITKGDTTVAGLGYLYWSLYGDKTDCNAGKFGFNGCYLQQIQPVTTNTQSTLTKLNDRSKSPIGQKDSYSDRFIPVRNESVSRKIWFDINEDSNSFKKIDIFSEDFENSLKYQSLLEGQIFGNSHSNSNASTVDDEKSNAPHTPPSNRPKLLTFRSSSKTENFIQPQIFMPLSYDKIPVDGFKKIRKIPEKSYKILEAPFLQDDYYLNLLDWSNGPYLAVALATSVYLWSPHDHSVHRLVETHSEDESYTSVSWNNSGDLLATGKYEGKLYIWDINKAKIVRDDFEFHEKRIGCLSWNGSNLLASGSRDKCIMVHDIRLPNKKSTVMKFKGHKQEVCGLKWASNEYHLASGGNDNKLFIWNSKKKDAEARFNEHKAAVKAIEWSPHQSGLLLTGGGNTDKCIKIWNTMTMKQINNVQTASQVCNLKFSRNSNEFVSTHGFSNNQIIIWKYPSMEKLGILEGHSSRVLYLTLSPDGQTVVTGAGDETLRFWNVFPCSKSNDDSVLIPSGVDLR